MKTINIKRIFTITVFAFALIEGAIGADQAYYSFEEGTDGSGGTGSAPTTSGHVVNDTTTNGPNGTVTSAYGSPVYSRYFRILKSYNDRKTALSFTNRNGYVTIPNSAIFQFSESLSKTVEFFVRRAGANWDTSTAEKIMAKGFSDSSNHGWEVFIDASSGLLCFIINENSLYSSSRVDDTQWHHVAITHVANSGEYKMYIDYQLENSLTNYTGGSVTSYNFVFGGYDWQKARVFNGSIDEVRFSDEALLPSDFVQNKPATMAYYNFEEGADGSGSVGVVPTTSGHVIDSAVFAQNGTATVNASSPQYAVNNLALVGLSARTRCLSFTAANGYITIPDSSIFKFEENASQTLEFFVRRAGANWDPSTAEKIMAKGFSDSSNHGWEVFIDASSGLLCFIINGNSLYSSSRVDDTQWHHVAITHVANSGEYKMYIDYQLENSLTNYTGGSVTSYNFVFGGYDWQKARVFNGSIDEVRFSNYVLTTKQFLRPPVGTVIIIQ